MNWHKWLEGLVAAVVSGASTAGVVVIADPLTFNPANGGARKFLTVMAVSGAFSFLAYLKQHPVPEP